jgi:Holliday junction resolvasome RuvABC ATP-dependent DNA helicase subunit
VRDFAEVGGGAAPEAPGGRAIPGADVVLRLSKDVAVSKEMAAEALRLEGVDELGLDRLDRMYLQTLAVNYQGGPAGVEALAASLNEEQQTLVDVVEPFLLKIGFIVRTPGGRKATHSGVAHVGASASGRAAKDAGQGRLV